MHPHREANIDPLGRKADVYRSLAREQWLPLTRRPQVRVAIFCAVVGLILLALAVPSILYTYDPTALWVGLLMLGHAVNELRPVWPMWVAWRRIGNVRLVVHDLNVIPGESFICTVEMTPRRDGQIREALLLLEYRDSTSGPGQTAWQVDVPLADTQLHAGVTTLLTAEVILPPGVPPSRFDAGWTRQWNLSGLVRLTDGRTWERAYPVMVYPSP